MKKGLLAAAVAATVVLSTASAFASPVEFDGTASYRYRVDTNDTTSDEKGSIFKLILNAKTNVAENLDVYARLGVQHLTNASVGSDFTTSGKTSKGALDQFGFNYSNADFNYKIGRQSATIGATALLYNNNYYVGKHSMVDGINITGKTGITSIDFLAAEEDKAVGGVTGDFDNRLYALRASYSPAKDWVVGATLAKYDYAGGAAKDDTNHWAVDASYTAGKATYFGEFTKSNASDDNRAYDLGVSYAFDDKNTAYVIAYNVQANGDMGAMTDFENNGKGFYYGVDHKFDKSTTGSLFFRQRSVVKGDANDNTSFRATVTYQF